MLRIRLPLLFLLACASAHLVAQETGDLRIFITDPSGAAVRDATILLQNDLNTTQPVEPGDLSMAFYIVQNLAPGTYRLEISKTGFDQYVVEKLMIHSRDRQVLRITLHVAAAAKQSVTVTSEVEGISADPSTGAVLDRQTLSELPVNSRSFTSLITFAPGVTDAGDGPDGGIHSNGLRSNTNYYMIDGVSANTGVSGGGPAGPGPGGPIGFGGGGANGTSVATNASGTSSNLISLDAMQEMQVQTSTFSPEYGRSPGAQISITSRGGTNDLHASLSEYFRNTALDANDWFNNENGFGRGTQRLYDTSLTAGGPLQKNKTFYFASFEESHVEQPHTEIDIVPDEAVRKRLYTSPLAPYLNAFPVPNGPEVGVDTADYIATYSTPSTSTSESFRIDRTISAKKSAFLRYSRSPSIASNRGGGLSTANTVSHRSADSQSLTGAYTWIDGQDQVNNIRVNVSRTILRSYSVLDAFGGAQVLPDSLIFPSGTNSSNGGFSMNVSGATGYSVGSPSATAQNQANIIFDEAGVAGNNSGKIGFDYRLLFPTYRVSPYSDFVSFNGISDNADSLLSGNAQEASVTSNVTARFPLYNNFSAYLQIVRKQNRYTTITIGVRYDLNPAPSVRSGPSLLGLDSSNNLSSSAPLYHTRWLNFAPRVGVANELSHTPGHEAVFRGGFGLFYDTGYGSTAAAFNNPPYSNMVATTQPSFPLNSDVTQAPVLPPTEPYGIISGAVSTLKSPIVWQFSALVEKHFGAGRVLTTGFLGSIGMDLLTTQSQPGFFSTSYSMLQLTSNGGNSNYRAFQTQYRQTAGRYLTVQGSYTFGQARDTQSNDSGFAGFAVVGGVSTGPSNYDIRQTGTGTATLALPSPTSSFGFLRPLLSHWFVDALVSAHTSLPFDVEAQAVQSGSSCPTSTTSNLRLCQQGFAAMVRPNLTGAPIWISDPHVPGGRRLNPAAFSVPTSGQGNEPRNALRGFDFFNTDLSLRKRIQVTERVSLQLRVDAYNALNHANFANPSGFQTANLASANFGVATSMLYNAFGGGSVQSSGAPRSLQLSIRAQF